MILCNPAEMVMAQRRAHVQVRRVRARAVLEQQASEAVSRAGNPPQLVWGAGAPGRRGAALSDSSVQLGGLVCTRVLFACVCVRMCLAQVLRGCGGCSVVVVRAVCAVCAVLLSRSISVLLSWSSRSRSRSGRSQSS